MGLLLPQDYMLQMKENILQYLISTSIAVSSL